jgi:protein involved in polysaccharide export with SLBB domain
VYFLRGPTTLMQLLSEAGGVAPAGVNEVRVSRNDQPDSVAVIEYEQLLRGGSADRRVAGGDIVFVPQSLVSVMGQVGKPGEVSFREGLTVSQCVAAAGGHLPTAALGNLYILRGDKRIRVNLRRILAGNADDLVLEAGDRLYVPESAI